jgi:hypothetical protein
MFELIGKVDEKLEYGTAAKQDLRRQQVNDFPHQEAAARDIGKDVLVQQAGTRLAHLGVGLP